MQERALPRLSECHDQRALLLRLRHRGHEESQPLGGEEAQPQAHAPPLAHPAPAPALARHPAPHTAPDIARPAPGPAHPSAARWTGRPSTSAAQTPGGHNRY
jgi:hypothetical protein